MKSNRKKRILAAILCMVMVLTSNISALAEGDSLPMAGQEQTVSEEQAPVLEEVTGDAAAQPTPEPVAPESTPAPTEVPATPEVTQEPTPEPTPEPTKEPETPQTPEPTLEPTAAPEPTEIPEPTPEVTPEPEEVWSEATELTQEWKDASGQLVQKITAKLPAGAFPAETSQITMEVNLLDTASENHIKNLMEKRLPQGDLLGDYMLYDIKFKVNGEIMDAQQPITITFEKSDLEIKDVKKANVFYYEPADPTVAGDQDELVEIVQRSEMIESLQASGQGTEQLEEYDLSSITVGEDRHSRQIELEGRTSTIYGCYVEYTPVLTLNFENDEVAVAVSADEAGIIPEDVALQVLPITADDKATKDQYEEVEKQIQIKIAEEEKELAGFLAYDISFVDAAGNEVEPKGKVKVSVKYKKAALPEDVKVNGGEDAEVSILHLEEDAKGNVKDVVNMSEKETTKVEAMFTTNGLMVKEVAVETESFSAFVITWTENAYQKFQVNVNYGYVDEKGNWKAIDDTLLGKVEDIKITNSRDAILLANYQKDLEKQGYRYSKTVVDDFAKGTEVKKLKAGSSGIFIKNYFVKYYTGDGWLDKGIEWLDDAKTTGEIYYVYEKLSPSISIVDDMEGSGSLKAQIEHVAEENVQEYKWYRSDSETGEYQEVEPITEEDGKTNLSEDKKQLYPLHDDGVGKWYKVSATLKDGTEVTSKPYQIRLGTVEIQDNLIESGSFQAIVPDSIKSSVTGYKWYKSSEKDGPYTLVEKKNFENGKSNISEKEDQLFPAYDNGARQWYKVSAILYGSAESEVSEPKQVEYYDALQNGGFEKGPECRNNSNQFSNKDYKEAGGVWQTTGLGSINGKSGQDIEILNAAAENINDGYSWYGPMYDAEEGTGTKQFAELNCEAAGALYQDVLTMEGQGLNYWLSHRARGVRKDANSEYDTMYLIIMPTKVAIENKLESQKNLKDYLRRLGLDPDEKYQKKEFKSGVYDQGGIYVARITSDDQKWFSNTSQYQEYVPNASLTRFFFMAGATASGGDTVGNFLDKVGFGQELPPVQKGEFSLHLNKKFQGLGGDELKKVRGTIQFEISIKQGERELTDEEIKDLLEIDSTIIKGTDMHQMPDGSLSYSMPQRKINDADTYEITITESGAECSGYRLEQSSQIKVKRGEETQESYEGEGNQAVVSEVRSETSAEVQFTNTYEDYRNKKINFTKVWDDNGGTVDGVQVRPESLDVTLTASYVVEENGVSVEKPLPELTETKTVTAPAWKTTWTKPVYYDYNNGQETQKVEIQYKITEGEIGGDYVYEKSNGGVALPGTGEGLGNTDFSGVQVLNNAESTTQQSNAKRSKGRSLAAESQADDSNKDSLGEPAHRKYIEYNANTGNYTLNLDVTGKKGETTGADILFVIDTSGSMDDYNLLEKVQNLLTKKDGIIDKIFAAEGNVNSSAFVSFAGKSETTSSSWYTTANKSYLKSGINSLRATGGTNWTYAMERAASKLEERSGSKNEKVVIFLSDGKPTYSMNGNKQTGNGSRTYDLYYTDAANRVKNSSALSAAKIYSVYLTRGTQDGMEKFAKRSGAECVDGTNLESALGDILNKVIPTYKDVTITDTLTGYVDMTGDASSVRVTKTVGGIKTTLDLSEYQVVVDGKTVSVQFTNEKGLEDGATYTVSFEIKPSQFANEEYAKRGYLHVGDSGTGATSEGKEGFHSNASATVDYTVNDQSGHATYKQPVVQVTTHKLTYEKQWKHPIEISDPTVNVVLHVEYTDGTSKNITLTAENDYRYEETVPVTKKIFKITEEPIDGYTPSYSITEGGTQAVVTNSYSKVTTGNLKVIKKWEDGEAKFTSHPAVTVQLYRSENGGEAVPYDEAVTLQEGSWEHTWKDLPQTEGSGEELVYYSYGVREVSVPENYTSNIVYDYGKDLTTVTITNVYDENCMDEDYYIVNTLQTAKVNIHKSWEDNDNPDRPIELNVNVNGENFTLTANEGWNKQITVVRRKNPSYSASETVPERYENISTKVLETADGGADIFFTNKLATTSITVEKIWNDGDIETRPGSIGFKLLYKKQKDLTWKIQGTYYLLAEDHDLDDRPWTKIIGDLSTAYEYKIEEIDTEGLAYISDVTGSQEKGFTIQNTLTWSVKKMSEQLADEEQVPLAGAEFELKSQDGKDIIATGKSGDDGIVTWTPAKGVDLNYLNGTYIIHETKAPNGYVLSDKDWTLTFDSGLLTQVDGEDVKGNATDGVVITLTNTKIYKLPSTGGPGIFVYTIGGTLLLMAAALLLYKMKREEVLKR